MTEVGRHLNDFNKIKLSNGNCLMINILVQCINYPYNKSIEKILDTLTPYRAYPGLMLKAVSCNNLQVIEYLYHRTETKFENGYQVSVYENLIRNESYRQQDLILS